MTENGFVEKLQASPLPVIVEVWAPWCIPCRQMQPSLERLRREYAGRLEVWQVNADEQPGLLQQWKVYAVPTILVYRQGVEVARKTGRQSWPALEALAQAALGAEAIVPAGIAPVNRILRLAAGLSLLALGWAGGQPLLLVAGLGVAFSGVYDRCPVWQALSARWKAWRGDLRRTG